jgi:CheY-like chemotaxis protein
MDENALDRLFEPRFTAHREEDTDPSLSTVHGVIEQSGGALTVYSEPGRGTRFEIFLPWCELPATAEAELSSEWTPDGKTVLVVEDEEIVRRATCRALREHGYDVLQARFGVDALEIERAHEGPIHLLLTDVVMPGMSGPELAERIRERRPDARVVFMSGYADDDALRENTEDVVFVSKPFPIPQLMQTLRAVLTRGEPQV